MNFREAASRIIKKHTGADDIALEVPPDPKLGDYAFPCFSLAKQLRKSPDAIASELAEKIKVQQPFRAVKSNGPYVNFFISREIFAKDIISRVLKGDYGRGKAKKEKIMIEYCQVNTHKAFHVGHLRGTILGSSLVSIFRFSGYNTKSVNYQGDIGAHVAKVIWYLSTHKADFPKKHRGRWLGTIYQKANHILSNGSKTDSLREEVSDVLQKLENGDRKLTALWKKTRQWSLDDFSEFYRTIGVDFDTFFFESEFEKPGKEIVMALLKKGIAEESEGAVIIDLEKHNLGKFLLLKSDGTALYSTKDLALAKEKFRRYRVDRSVYVVGAEQRMYFQQLFKTLEIMGFGQARDCVHVPFGLVNLKGGKISSREGELIYAEQLVEDVIADARKAIRERHKGLGNKEAEERARKIGIAAIKFSFLNQDNSKEIIFDKGRSLSFEGETGPYVQYTYARISSIIRKSGRKHHDLISWDVNEPEHNLVRMLDNFPVVVSHARDNYKPMEICRYLLDLCQSFNQYYHSTPVLKAEKKELRQARLTLIYCVREIIMYGLSLLGIDAVEEM